MIVNKIFHFVRGGSFIDVPKFAPIADRYYKILDYRINNLGFRLVEEIETLEK